MPDLVRDLGHQAPIRLVRCPQFGGGASVGSRIPRGTGKRQWACEAVLRLLRAAICLQKMGIMHTEYGIGYSVGNVMF